MADAKLFSLPHEGDVKLFSLPHEVLADVLVPAIDCHFALVRLSSTCSAARRLLCDAKADGQDALPRQTLLQAQFLKLTADRGWYFALLPGSNTGDDDDDEFWKKPLLWPAHDPMRHYARRAHSLPSPHASWPIAKGRVLHVGAAGHFPTLRAALAAARDADTLLLSPGTHDEGADPIELSHSVRVLGAPPTAHGGDSVQQLATTLRAELCASGGHGALCGLVLSASVSGSPPLPSHPELEPDALRCFAVSASAVWSIEDCQVFGSMRVGGQAELALVRCRVEADATHAASTGILVQGRARALIRACLIQGHARSGVTVQQRARLWMHHSVIRNNGLAGVKWVSKEHAPSVLSCCHLSSNRRMGLMLRSHSTVHLDECEVCENMVGVACIEDSELRVTRCTVGGNRGVGLVCQDRSRASVDSTLVLRNEGNGLAATNQSSLAIARTTSSRNGGSGLHAEEGVQVLVVGGDNRFNGNERGGLNADPGARVEPDFELPPLEQTPSAAGGTEVPHVRWPHQLRERPVACAASRARWTPRTLACWPDELCQVIHAGPSLPLERPGEHAEELYGLADALTEGLTVL